MSAESRRILQEMRAGHGYSDTLTMPAPTAYQPTLASSVAIRWASRPRNDRSRVHQVAVVFPGGNTTALVSDQRMQEDRAVLNKQLTDALRALPELPPVEQCGFITRPHDVRSIARLEMFGGEFCGNATRSVAWHVTGGTNYDGLIEVSGIHHPLRFSVLDGVVSLEMPLADTRRGVRTIGDTVWVHLDGIVHVVITDRAARRRCSPRVRLEALLARDVFDLRSQSAVGVTYYDQFNGEAEFCVWVKNVDTVFDETACGSGTCAIGLAQAAALRVPADLAITQPSGETIRVRVQTDATGQPVSCVISGEVRTLYEGAVVL